MGAPIARALSEAGCSVVVANRTRAKAESLAAECPGMAVASTAAEACAGADMVVLAVKPHMLLGVMDECLAAAPAAAYVSLAPGIDLATLEQRGASRAVRLMPNVAIARGCGMSFICHNDAASADALALGDALKVTGRTAIVEERLFEPAMAGGQLRHSLRPALRARGRGGSRGHGHTPRRRYGLDGADPGGRGGHARGRARSVPREPHRYSHHPRRHHHPRPPGHGARGLLGSRSRRAALIVAAP